MSSYASQYFPLMVFRFIPYIEDSVLGLSVMASGLFLYNGGRPLWDRDLKIHPPSQSSTSAYLNLHPRNLGVLPSIQIGPRDEALCVDLGGKVRAIITPHSSGQPKVYSPRNAYMLVKSKKFTIITRYKKHWIIDYGILTIPVPSMERQTQRQRQTQCIHTETNRDRDRGQRGEAEDII